MRALLTCLILAIATSGALAKVEYQSRWLVKESEELATTLAFEYLRGGKVVLEGEYVDADLDGFWDAFYVLIIYDGRPIYDSGLSAEGAFTCSYSHPDISGITQIDKDADGFPESISVFDAAGAVFEMFEVNADDRLAPIPDKVLKHLREKAAIAGYDVSQEWK